MNNQDLLNRHFSNSLTADQEVLFKKLLETDNSFKLQYDFENNLKYAINSLESENLKSKLQGFEKSNSSQSSDSFQFFESEKTNSKSTSFNYKSFAIAASIALLVGWFGYNSLFNANYNNFYDINYSDYPNTVYNISRSDSENSLEREAFVAYEAKDYNVAIIKFDALDDDEKKEYIDFYKAQSYLGLENNEDAKTLFEQVIKENEVFVAESIWYLALIAIKEKNIEQAKTYLQELVNNHSYNIDKAQELLNELN